MNVGEIIVNTLQGLLAFVLVLAPLVFVHEFGHFIVAKMLHIGVPVFSVFVYRGVYRDASARLAEIKETPI